MTMSDWDREMAFWTSSEVDTFDLEESGSGYYSYRTMEKQPRVGVDNRYCWGDWVRSEDYRRDVEALEKQLAESRAELAALKMLYLLDIRS